MIPEWKKIPEKLKNNYVKKYYNCLIQKKNSLILKRLFDISLSIILILLLSPLMVIISIIIKLTSKGPVYYKSKRITQYGKVFYMFKFRTMEVDSDLKGKLTTKNDQRVTKVGKFLRKFRIDEFPQLINILLGQLSFVGTRPEDPKYVAEYSDEMVATLLLPAGVTSIACINFRDEDEFFTSLDNVDQIYMNDVLPQKMKYNFDYLNKFNFFLDIKIIILTVLRMIQDFLD